MQTQLASVYRDTPDGRRAQEIIGKCVHCGFCTATCPSYQILGDELDGPRGRIYQIKQVFEGCTATEKTQLHLDRCLSCRSCESTCPSGVDYAELLDLGRHAVDKQVVRSWTQRLLRTVLATGLTSAWFAPAMRLGKALRPVLPKVIKDKIPVGEAPGVWPAPLLSVPPASAKHPSRLDPNPSVHSCPSDLSSAGRAGCTQKIRKVLLQIGCVQPAMLPNIHYASARVLHAFGVECVLAPQTTCCGAVKLHLDDAKGSLAQMRANIDAWWPYIESGQVQAIVSDASACGAMVKDYARHLHDDPAYASKAGHCASLCKDISELLDGLLSETDCAASAVVSATAGTGLLAELRGQSLPSLIFHPPCTLQHGQRLGGKVESVLTRLGFAVTLPAAEVHLCCGSAGTYSVLQPVLSEQLRARKLGHIHARHAQTPAQYVVSANVGCIAHLQAGCALPVRHWIEVVDMALTRASKAALSGQVVSKHAEPAYPTPHKMASLVVPASLDHSAST